MDVTSLASFLPVIPDDKQYWLIRTQGGKYYNDFKKGNFIAINWDDITIEDINTLSDKELVQKVKQEYPEIRRAARTANQLRIFHNIIKKGDIVIITSYSSNRLTIGEVIDGITYIEIVDPEVLEENQKKCPFQKRKKVNWLKTVNKYDIDKNLFMMLQHSQHTISVANDYGDSIESLLHNFFIRGDRAQLALNVKREDNIPLSAFFPMGSEIIELAKEFNKFSPEYKINIEDIDIQVNVNSPGKMKMVGIMSSITILGMLIVASTGGHFKITFPSAFGGGEVDIKVNSIVKVVGDFMKQRQEMNHKDILLRKYMNDLVVETPEELKEVLSVFSESSNNSGNEGDDASKQ